MYTYVMDTIVLYCHYYHDHLFYAYSCIKIHELDRAIFFNRKCILCSFWSLMRMVNFTHDAVTSVMTLISPIVNFPYLSSNIPESPVYGAFVSQLIRYVRVCSKYEDFLLFRGSILVLKLLEQGYSYWSRDILHGNFRLLFGNYMFVIVLLILFTNLTLLPLLCHICWRVCSQTR